MFLVNSKTENRKTLEGSSWAHKGKIKAKEDLSRDHESSKARWLATSTNQPPERSHVCEPLAVHKLCHFISDIMDYFLAGEDQQQTNQPNDLAGG